MTARLSAAHVHQLSRNLVRHYPFAAHLPLALIVPPQQRLYVVRHFKNDTVYPVSLSRFGLGNLDDSLRTPYGVHRVADKIGDGQPLHTRFIGRRTTGERAPPTRRSDSAANDAICTRILRLEGLEPGINRGGFMDSYSRYIYIHGTPHERHIGRSASVGCIRMRNADVVRLFDTVEIDSLIYIFNMAYS